ncbi:MAG: two-component regulator propeller domain-containing protein [Bacteroidota bacterium]|nr:two-component regulator propeller domain-containing protein [Bacteroidota bacterium]
MKIKIFSIIILSFVVILTSCKDGTQDVTPYGPVWVTFPNRDIPNLISNNIHSISRGSDGRIWFGTDSGGVSYYNNSWKRDVEHFECWFYGQGGRINIPKVTAIAKGYGVGTWFGSWRCGVTRYNSASQDPWKKYLPGEAIKSIAVDHLYYGDVWVVTFGDTYCIKPLGTEKDTVLRYFSQPLLSGSVNCVTFNPVNKWFFFGTNAGFVYLNDNNELGDYYLTGPNKSTVKAIAVEYSNTVWLGKVYGLTSFNPSTNVERHYPEIRDVISITTDFYSVCWIGTSTGLYQMKDSTKTAFTTRNTSALPSNRIQSLYYDNKGNLWIGTDKGIAVYNEKGTQL